MEFRCFNGTANCNYCGSCHADFQARTSDEKRRIYNKALDDFERKMLSFCFGLKASEGNLCRVDVIEDELQRVKRQLKK